VRAHTDLLASTYASHISLLHVFVAFQVPHGIFDANAIQFSNRLTVQGILASRWRCRKCIWPAIR
jgi:hypothetical protein